MKDTPPTYGSVCSGIAAGTIEAPDVLVGGTPCQAFSFAGLRESMDPILRNPK